MRIKKPDIKKIENMISSAERDIKFTLSLPITEYSSNTIIRNIYESFRLLGDALLLLKGLESEDHITTIQELTELKIKTNKPLRLIDNLRKLRHNINYYGYSPSKEEVEFAITLAQELFYDILNEIKKRIKQ